MIQVTSTLEGPDCDHARDEPETHAVDALAADAEAAPAVPAVEKHSGTFAIMPTTSRALEARARRLGRKSA